ncbi:hypothetical protein BE20_17565 [Sorangium cellulosum]|uniref:Uncharacterized protein n=1 Tax=Sorangium cellulosum TaxID=56 RepID=A0A150RHA6_SORCE|nr:hypothetical protein BE18_32275 [Sorangium cellulosum]KYF90489.1 hypothetical protein BE20_17565 [Sorangium cellulosum]
MSAHNTEIEQQARFKDFMTSFMCLLDIMAFFASPRLAAKGISLPSREHILQHLDAYIPVAAEWERNYDGSTRRITTAHAQKLRDLFSAWMPDVDIPADIVQGARAFLDEFGIEPQEGWDAFEGPPEETQAVLTSKPAPQ